jgi:Rrf2 family protein
LRAVVWLGSFKETPQTSEQIARGTGVPPRYLYKVLQTMTGAGLLESQPGPGGGYFLARPAAAITMLDVIQAFGPIQRIRTCPLGHESHIPNLCPLHRELDAAFAQMEQAFARVTIARFLKQHTSTSLLCD